MSRDSSGARGGAAFRCNTKTWPLCTLVWQLFACGDAALSTRDASGSGDASLIADGSIASDGAAKPSGSDASDTQVESGLRDAAGDTVPGVDANTGRAPLEPAEGVLLGLYYGDTTIGATEQLLGRPLPIHLTYYTFDDDWTQGVTAADLNAGRIPLVNWEMYDPTYTLEDISNGVHDTMLHARAASAKALAAQFFVDFGAEMNGNWSPWGGAQNGMKPDGYVAAYRHIHDLFVADGARNVVWLWCPNVTDEPNESWNHALGYYPGDSYVDWTCVDGYNWGSSNGHLWQSVRDLFGNIYKQLAAKNKPIMIGEMASAEEGGDKSAWIDSLVPTLHDSFPMVHGLVWFDVNKETDWRIRSSPASTAAFKRFVQNAYTNP